MIQGSNHPRTARSATGQDTGGRAPFSSLIFFPRSRCSSRNAAVEGSFWLRWRFGLLRRAGRRVRGMIPAKGERTPDQLPVPPDGFVAPDLILGPAQSVFDVFVALLDPHAQPVQPYHLFQAGCRERRVGSRALGWRRQVGDQVPGGEVGQGLWVSGGYYRPFRLVWPIRPGHDLQHPPLLGAPIAEGPGDWYPLAGVLGTLPARLVRHVLQRPCDLLWMPPRMRGFEGQHIRHGEPAQPFPHTA